MTKYLIDTHILIWLAVSPTKISKNIIKIIENTDNKICVSSISFWEIAIKISIGKLSLQGLTIEDLVQFCIQQDIEIVQLPISAVTFYSHLSIKENHRDPFDRALISLCITDNYIFLSVDDKLHQYKNDGLIFIN
ncbi:MAG: type II toxin-antitoxin system VapC family toxin [Neisseriaceae bacterium]|nr:type II toxin-antitoxin system VapC family toxin [Neisseriaceae bacterium]MBQ9260073.1 type II toxin-antitoxin system VapC family toxin [Neisseriaceae bacterium]MBQ9724904.1 type II toxin-antitoxin system VapC family toxin [Neisseriaceae bacterium]MBR1818739.1 type II toxin-antitoxin system VapC family toxin [Neisseriaceae bacterium]